MRRRYTMGVDQLLERSARRAPDRTAVVCAGTRCSYQELDEQANRLAHALIDAGLQPGDRVAICLESSLNAVVSIFAVLKAGGVFVVINPPTTMTGKVSRRALQAATATRPEEACA